MKFFLIVYIGANLLYPLDTPATYTYSTLNDCKNAALLVATANPNENMEAKCFDKDGKLQATFRRGQD